MGDRRGFALLVLLLLSAFTLYGCTGGAKYTSCCVREKIFDTSVNPPKILDNPSCVFADGSNEANPYPCGKDATEQMGGTARCSEKLCRDITKEEECKGGYGCVWDSIAGRCNSASGGDGRSYTNFPICTDAIPKNCINNACQAMVCGFTGYKTDPPPTAEDFQSGSIPTSEIGAGAINLQGTSCDFRVMNRKLYNQFRMSQGALWVNSFRFGVGRSFSDFEQSRYLFPPSDRFCSSSLFPGRDRFLVYNNALDTWCGNAASQGLSQYYACGANKLNFSDEATCSKYCFGRTQGSNPPDCLPKPVVASQPKNWCRADNFIFNSRNECRLSCAILDDPGACSTDLTKFPFLDNGGKDDGRVKTKLEADYYYGTTTTYEDCGFWGCDGSYEKACKQESWRDEGSTFDKHYWCSDFYPWDCTGEDFSSDTCIWNGNPNDDMEELRWPKSRVFSSEPDTEYYSARLLAQAGTSPEQKAPFECESSHECLSGACSTSDYNRVMCKDKDDPKTNIYCGCKLSGTGYSCGSSGAARSIYYDTGNSFAGVGNVIEQSDMRFGLGRGNDQTYYITGGADPAPDFPLIANCGIAPFSHKNQCIAYVYHDDGDRYADQPFYMIVDTDDADECKDRIESFSSLYPLRWQIVPVWAYQTHFTSGTNPDKDWGSLGKCKLLDQPSAVQPPYLDAHVFGWCEACTSSTLAVQKVTFSPPWEHTYPYNCLEFRATYDYSVQNGIEDPLTGGGYGPDRIEARSFDVASVSRAGALLGYTPGSQNGPIERGYYDQGWFGHDVKYVCTDGWTGGWHGVTVPSQAQLVEKMTQYMSANVMPILDFDQSNVPLSVGSQPVFGGLFSIKFKYSTNYDPTNICGAYGADGAAIYVVGDYNDVKGTGVGGEIYEGDKVASENPDILNYFTQRGDITSTRTLPASYNSISTADTLSSRAAAIYKAWTLKKSCPNPPLAAITMNGNEDLETEIGDKENQGPLHEFFFSKQNFPPGSYDIRVAQGTPDKYPDEVDLILDEWHPRCLQASSTKDKIEYEFESRLNRSRALLSNFSKPTLVWRFDFPQDSNCFEIVNGKKDYQKFLGYVFGRQADMVDAGLIGLIYDNWMTSDGGAYLAYVPDHGIADGTSATPASQGALDLPYATGGQPAGKTEIFCALQNASKKVLGLDKLTFGQKILAEKKPDGTQCTPCKSDNGNDVSGGICTTSTDPNVINDPELPQIYCAGGHKCSMPPDAGGNQRTDYGNFFCPAFSVDYDLCTPCSSITNRQAYCRIEHSDGAVEEKLVDYASLSDADWNIIAALPNKDKCCLSTTTGSDEEKYTYTQRAGVKQKNELLQFPRRGEPEIDCGRPPSTDLLKYCNVQVLSSNSISYCSAIEK